MIPKPEGGGPVAWPMSPVLRHFGLALLPPRPPGLLALQQRSDLESVAEVLHEPISELVKLRSKQDRQRSALIKPQFPALENIHSFCKYL